jgi:hypothetical protein
MLSDAQQQGYMIAQTLIVQNRRQVQSLAVFTVFFSSLE